MSQNNFYTDILFIDKRKIYFEKIKFLKQEEIE